MGLLEFLLITLINTVICLCLPKVVALISSKLASQSKSLSHHRTLSSQPEPSSSQVYPELINLTR